MTSEAERFPSDKLNVVCAAWVGPQPDRGSVEWVVGRERSEEAKRILEAAIAVLRTHVRSTVESPQDLLAQIRELEKVDGDGKRHRSLIRAIQIALYAALASHINARETRGWASTEELRARDLVGTRAQELRFGKIGKS